MALGYSSFFTTEITEYTEKSSVVSVCSVVNPIYAKMRRIDFILRWVVVIRLRIVQKNQRSKSKISVIAAGSA